MQKHVRHRNVGKSSFPPPLWCFPNYTNRIATHDENAMAGCVYKTSAKEAKIEAGELGRAAGTAVPHHSPGTSQREAREGCAPSGTLPWWPGLGASQMTLTAMFLHLTHGAHATQFEGLCGVCGWVGRTTLHHSKSHGGCSSSANCWGKWPPCSCSYV